jgi:hypothetical protein
MNGTDDTTTLTPEQLWQQYNLPAQRRNAIAAERAGFIRELQHPHMIRLLAGALGREQDSAAGQKDVLEALLNRAAAHRLAGTYTSMYDELTGGFYGPVNRGEVARDVAAGISPERISQTQDMLTSVGAGRNVLRGLTDQGMRNEIRGPATESRGEFYGMMPGLNTQTQTAAYNTAPTNDAEASQPSQPAPWYAQYLMEPTQYQGGGVADAERPEVDQYTPQQFGREPEILKYMALGSTPNPAAITAESVQNEIQGLPQIAGTPTAASYQAAGEQQSALEAQQDEYAGYGGDMYAQSEPAVPESAGEGISVGAMPIPDISHMKVTGRSKDGTVSFNNGAVKVNARTGMMSYEMDGNTFVQQGPFAKATRIPHKYYHDIGTNTLWDTSKLDAQGRPTQIPIPGAVPKIDSGLMAKILQYDGPLTNPDGSPFRNNQEAYRALQTHMRDQGIPTQSQWQAIRAGTQALYSGRNRVTGPWLAMATQLGAAEENLKVPYEERNGIDDALLISQYYGIERPGYQPATLDFQNLMKGIGPVSAAELTKDKAKALGLALKSLFESGGQQMDDKAKAELMTSKLIPKTRWTKCDTD